MELAVAENDSYTTRMQLDKDKQQRSMMYRGLHFLIVVVADPIRFVYRAK
jgi:hypothetical protein